MRGGRLGAAAINYYERHIGDYLKDTAHLSLLEHGVYTRLMDVYYTTEAPIPDDKACRLIAAKSAQERQAVRDVLEEFFTLTDGCWHQDRCDLELARYRDGEPEREARKANENNRLKRHRDERAALFQQLTAAGQHAPWNVSMAELRKLVQRPIATPATLPPPLPVTAPATPATATQSPLPNTHTPSKEKETAGSPQSVDPPTSPPPFDGNNAETLNGKSVVALAQGFDLPEAWGMDAESLGWQPREVLLEAEKFRQHWTAGKGAGKRRSVKGWRQSWSNWLAIAAEKRR